MATDSYRVLVYGWYHQQNLGDDMFAEAFRSLFPEFSFSFSNCLTKQQVGDCDAVFFGGGSFLDNPVRCDPGALEAVRKKPILYIGVGMETSICPDHLELLKVARLVAARGGSGQAAVRTPDIVYSLPRATNVGGPNTVLFVPNVATVPTGPDPHWKHSSWSYFKSECAQFLDELVDDGYAVRVLKMCRSDKLDDAWPAAEIVGQMRNRERSLILDVHPRTHAEAMSVFTKFRHVVTQRFHGMVLAEMAGSRCVSIVHHQKLSEVRGGAVAVPYYGVTKPLLKGAMHGASAPADLSRDDARALSVMCNAARKVL